VNLEQFVMSLGDEIGLAVREAIDKRMDERSERLRQYTRTAVKEAVQAERKRNRQALAEISRALADLDARVPKRADAGVVPIGQRRVG